MFLVLGGRLETTGAIKIKEIKKILDPLDDLKLYNRNILYGVYEIEYEGQKITENVIAISGSDNVIVGLPEKITFEGIEYNVLTKSKLGQNTSKDWGLITHDAAYGNGIAANDSEIKLFRQIIVDINNNFVISLSKQPNQVFQGLKGYISYIDEMSPCPSCVKVIDNQAIPIFGNQVKIDRSDKVPYIVKH